MKCPNHLTRDAAGYCYVCGTFYCSDCLHQHEGNFYCPKHFKPIAGKMGVQSRLAEGRKRHSRHTLVVHFLDGRRMQGTSRNLNIREHGFFLECENDQGISTNESVRVSFDEVKNVCNVKSYDGKFDRSERFQEYTAGGTHIIVKFLDGEIMEGVTLHTYVRNTPRFYLIPIDANSNNINVLVESRAVERVYTPDEYRAVMQEQKQQKSATAAAPVQEAELGQDESMGDFYFETHNYPGALSQYQVAQKQHPGSQRLSRKIVVTTVNIGIQYIKTRDYRKALDYMEKALELDPANPHAKKKAKQLRHIIEKTERRMREYEKQRESWGKNQQGL